MRRLPLCLLAGIAASVLATAIPEAAGATSDGATAAKVLKCKKGYQRKHVRRHGRLTYICVKKKTVPKTPTKPADAGVPAPGTHSGGVNGAVSISIGPGSTTISASIVVPPENVKCAPTGPPDGTAIARIDQTPLTKEHTFDATSTSSFGTVEMHGKFLSSKSLHVYGTLTNAPAGQPGDLCNATFDMTVTLT